MDYMEFSSIQNFGLYRIFVYIEFWSTQNFRLYRIFVSKRFLSTQNFCLHRLFDCAKPSTVQNSRLCNISQHTQFPSRRIYATEPLDGLTATTAGLTIFLARPVRAPALLFLSISPQRRRIAARGIAARYRYCRVFPREFAGRARNYGAPDRSSPRFIRFRGYSDGRVIGRRCRAPALPARRYPQCPFMGTLGNKNASSSFEFIVASKRF